MNAPMLTTADMLYYDEFSGGSSPTVNDPRFTPLAATDFTGMPPTLVFTAECDPLSGDGPDYCERITTAGGKAICIEEVGLVHGYLRARHSAVARETASPDGLRLQGTRRRPLALLRQKRRCRLQTNRRAIRSLHCLSNTWCRSPSLTGLPIDRTSCCRSASPFPPPSGCASCRVPRSAPSGYAPLPIADRPDGSTSVSRVVLPEIRPCADPGFPPHH
jgi:hypothetical protein